eukprot:722793-Prymnesium_polylepis.1
MRRCWLALVAELTSAHSGFVNSVAFSPDGTRIVSGSRDTSIKLWGGRAIARVYGRLRFLLSLIGRVWLEVFLACAVCAHLRDTDKSTLAL